MNSNASSARKQDPRILNLVANGLSGSANFGVPTVTHKIGQYSVADWLSRDLSYKHPLLEPWLMPEARYMIWGPTGCGKTAVMLAMAFAAATGKSLGNWRAPKPIRVIYIDGEMSRRDLQMRLRELCETFGSPGNRLRAISTADAQTIYPLDLKEPRMRLGMLIDKFAPDIIILDNIQCLVSRSIKDGDAYDHLQPVMLNIRNRGICSVWGHHAGFNSEHAYGDSRIAWQMSGTLKIQRIKENSERDDQLKVRISVDKPFRELREDVARIPQILVFKGTTIDQPDTMAGAKLSPDAKILNGMIGDYIAQWGRGYGRVTGLRKEFDEALIAKDRNQNRNSLRPRFNKALKRLEELGMIMLSGTDGDRSWELI